MNADGDKKLMSWSEAVIKHASDLSEALDHFLFENGATALMREETRDGVICRAGFGVEEPPDTFKQDLEAFLVELSGMFELRPSHSVTWETVFEDTWSEQWKRDLGPIEVGTSLVIKPSWHEYQARVGATVLNLDPGLAFGTGLHASTRFCLDALTEFFSLPENAEARVLDVGTGSGILAMSAAALSRGFIAAIDNDPQVLPVAAGNIENNGLTGRVALACAEPASIKGQFDLILANIFSGALIRLAPRLESLCADNAKLILSGILTHQAESVADRFTSIGFFLDEQRSKGEWAALILTKFFERCDDS
ncbi:MAG: 50S ribosomal protein L11 methyltransferase [Deltaproteobacteria bacterium]|nr:50S ribosomal protein L11 methyltransferase [Deltaproteobacteria bacterium]